MKTYPIPVALMQDIVNVLQGLPWGQVNGIMGQLVPIIHEIDGRSIMVPRGNGKEDNANV